MKIIERTAQRFLKIFIMSNFITSNFKKNEKFI